MLRDPRVLILDDATSSVDAVTERQIREALEEVMAGRTTLIIAHRTSTLALADRVALVDEGRVVAVGSHRELLERAPLRRGPRRHPRRGERGGVVMYARFGGAENKVDRPLALLAESRPIRDGPGPAGSVGHARHPAGHGVEVAEPLVIRRGVDDGVTAGDLETLTVASVVYLVLLGVQYVLGRWSLQAVGSVAERLPAGLRVRVFAHLMSLDIPYFSRSKAGVLVSRMTLGHRRPHPVRIRGRVQRGQFGSHRARGGGGDVLRRLDARPRGHHGPSPALGAGLGGVPPIRRSRLPAGAEQIGQVLATLQEGIAGVRVVQAYTQEEGQATRFGRVNRSYYEANIAAARAISTYFPAMDFIRTVGIALVLLVGGFRVADGLMSFGSLVAFLLYINWFFEPLVQLSNVYNLLQAALAALSKLFGLLDEQPEVAEAVEAVPLPEAGAGELRFEGVTFGYDPAAPVLHQVDLTVPAGTRLAVVGETGAGRAHWPSLRSGSTTRSWGVSVSTAWT